jgi:hypothetical protein
MVDESQPTAKALLLHAAQSSESVLALNKVSAFALPSSSHHVIANDPKIITNDTTPTNMPIEAERPHSPEQNCPLFKLSAELRLEICRFAIQHTLDLINPPPNTKHRYSAAQTTRGALALLYTCRTLRAESIDAMEPLAKASKSALQYEIDLSGTRYSAAVRDMSQLVFVARPSLEYEWNQLKTMAEIDVVCSVLALAREADEMMRAGRKMGRARK